MKTTKIEIDLSEWSRLPEVCAYADARQLSLPLAIRELVNHALRTPSPTPESYARRKVAGADALRKAFPTLEEDFMPSWFAKAVEIVLEATL